MNDLLIFALIGGVLNRFSGFTNISWLPGRNVYYAILVATALTFALFGWQWALVMFAGFALYRIPGWYKSLDMGTVGGTLKGDAGIMFLRGLMFAPPFLYAAYLSSDLLPVAVLAAASVGAVVSYIIGNHVLGKFIKVDPFWFIEFFAGASFGAALGFVLPNLK
jgi:hypothetical protein